MEDPNLFIIRLTLLHQYIIIIGPYHNVRQDKASVTISLLFFLGGGLLCSSLSFSFKALFYFFQSASFVLYRHFSLAFSIKVKIHSSTRSYLQVNTCEGLCVWQKLGRGRFWGGRGIQWTAGMDAPVTPYGKRQFRPSPVFPAATPIGELSVSATLAELQIYCRVSSPAFPRPSL